MNYIQTRRTRSDHFLFDADNEVLSHLNNDDKNEIEKRYLKLEYRP